MGQTIEQGGGHLGIAEDIGPCGEAHVGGDDQLVPSFLCTDAGIRQERTWPDRRPVAAPSPRFTHFRACSSAAPMGSRIRLILDLSGQCLPRALRLCLALIELIDVLGCRRDRCFDGGTDVGHGGGRRAVVHPGVVADEARPVAVFDHLHGVRTRSVGAYDVVCTSIESHDRCSVRLLPFIQA
jgi:hypothetical protein